MRYNWIMKETWLSETAHSAFIKCPFYPQLAQELLNPDEGRRHEARLEAIQRMTSTTESCTLREWCAILYTFEHCAYIMGAIGGTR